MLRVVLLRKKLVSCPKTVFKKTTFSLHLLGSFTYHSHPDIFQEVTAEQPVLIKFLSNPVVGAALGAIAAKWFGGHK